MIKRYIIVVRLENLDYIIIHLNKSQNIDINKPKFDLDICIKKLLKNLYSNELKHRNLYNDIKNISYKNKTDYKEALNQFVTQCESISDGVVEVYELNLSETDEKIIFNLIEKY